MQIFVEGNKLGIKFKFNPALNETIKHMPSRRWLNGKKIWVFDPTLDNIEYIHQHVPSAEWSEEAQKLVDEIIAAKNQRDMIAEKQIDVSDPLHGVPFKLPPFNHQREALILGRDMPAFAYLMEQGTGKSKVLLDDAAHNFRVGRIDCLIIICPNSVKTNWVDPEGGQDEVSTHMAPDIDYAACAYFGNPKQHQRKKVESVSSHIGDPSVLKIYVFNIEAMNVERVVNDLEYLLRHCKCMIAIDESTRIKNRSAKRTKAVTKLRALAPVARIMSGTPLIKSPLDAYAQFRFLDRNILGFATYSAFSHRYARFGGHMGKQVIGYYNLDELAHKVAGASYRVLKENCIDLPPKIYAPKRKINMTDRQRDLYKEMRENMIVWLDEQHVVNASVVLTQLLRLQQITSNYLPIIDPLTGEQKGVSRINEMSPKIEEVMNILDESSGKMIVWCRFKAEIHELGEHLEKAGIGYVKFYGDISDEQRVIARNRFQTDDSIRVFIGQIRTGGIGLTLTAAQHVVYLSNTFSTEERIQSEDRAHRIGQKGNVTYYDMYCPGTVDLRIINVLRENKRLADEVMRDGWQDWI